MRPGVNIDGLNVRHVGTSNIQMNIANAAHAQVRIDCFRQEFHEAARCHDCRVNYSLC